MGTWRTHSKMSPPGLVGKAVNPKHLSSVPPRKLEISTGWLGRLELEPVTLESFCPRQISPLFFARTTWLILSSTSLPGILLSEAPFLPLPGASGASLSHRALVGLGISLPPKGTWPPRSPAARLGTADLSSVPMALLPGPIPSRHLLDRT